MEGFKPCPFCGNKDIRITPYERYVEDSHAMRIQCKGCDTNMWDFDFSDDLGDNYEARVALIRDKWNRRV